jgi:hypothetical protein
MTGGFQSFSDSNGNLWVADGYVSQLRSGVRLPIGAGDEMPPLLLAPDGSRYVPAAMASAGTFVGGSGRNLTTTGLTPSVSGPALPVGIWQPQRPDVWTLGIFTLTKTGASAANIHDGTDTVASLTTGSAPVGDYVASSYGQTTYSGSSAFTLAAAAEEGAPGTIPSYVLSVSAGTAHAGTYAPSTATAYAAATDADWTIICNSDGTADLKHSGTTMATRAAGSDCEAGGIYEATAAGMAAYNSGDPWRAFVQVISQPPRAGFVYVKLTEAGGVLTNAEGPFFSTALPADSATVFYVPLAQSDGLGGRVQLHTGLLIWSGLPVAGEMASEYVEMTTPRVTSSATLEDIPGATASITLAVSGKIAVFMNCEVSSDGICDLGLAISIGGTDHDETTIHLSGAADAGTSAIMHRSGTLAAGTYTVKGRFRRVSGSPKIPGVDRVDLMVVSLQGAMGAAGSDGATGPMGDPDKTSRNLFILGL